MGHSRNTTSSRARPGAPTVDPIAAGLATHWPAAVCEIDHANGFQLLCGTILAAQSTDKMINTITPALFARYPDAQALAQADPAALEPLIFKSGFYRNKAKSLIGMARALVTRHDGQVPATMAALVELPGVARKTANVILWTVFGKNEGVVVDTHVTRLAQRLGLSKHTEPVAIEQDLQAVVPREEWGRFADRLIWHGRRVCAARNPACGECLLAPMCPSANVPGRGEPRDLAVKKDPGKRAAGAKAAREREKEREKESVRAKAKASVKPAPAKAAVTQKAKASGKVATGKARR